MNDSQNRFSSSDIHDVRVLLQAIYDLIDDEDIGEPLDYAIAHAKKAIAILDRSATAQQVSEEQAAKAIMEEVYKTSGVYLSLGVAKAAARALDKAADRAVMPDWMTRGQPQGVRLEARLPDDSQEWTEIFPAQLQWMAKEGNQVRAIELVAPPQPAQADAPIFAECAEIALEHVGQATCLPEIFCTGYNTACVDISDAIKLRASNRKVMDALAPAAPQGVPNANEVRIAAINECVARLDDIRCIPINSMFDRTEALKDAQVTLRALSLTRPDREGK